MEETTAKKKYDNKHSKNKKVIIICAKIILYLQYLHKKLKVVLKLIILKPKNLFLYPN